MARWLRIHLPLQGTWVRSLVREDPTCCGATKPVSHNDWACTLEPVSHNYWSPRATTIEAHVPRARAPQQEKPLQWQARAPQWRVAPARCNKRKPARSNEDPMQPKIKLKKKKKGFCTNQGLDKSQSQFIVVFTCERVPKHPTIEQLK